MFVSLRKYLLLLVLVLCVGIESAHAFSLLGPREAYQILPLGYPGDFSDGTKNLGDEFRWNTPVVYYACDASFLDYFGSNGVYAVDQAFAILNNLTNLSTYSSDLSEFSLNTSRFNGTASALHLYDLKSGVLEMMVEHLGLGDPARFVWTLRNRVALVPTCEFHYTVIERNFDPITLVPSPYINGELFSYVIVDSCPLPPGAITIPFPVDALGDFGTSVASAKIIFDDVTAYGLYYTGLTRDDVGGFRYLMNTNNINWENVSTNSLLVFTNQQSQLLVTSNLATLIAQSQTNDPATLQGLYPGLIVASTTNFYTNVVTTNFTAFFAGAPYAPAGTVKLVLATNLTTNVAVRFIQTFANVVTNTFYTRGFMTFQQTNISSSPFGPVGSVQTNIISSTMLTNFPNGDFYIVPTNLCGYQIIATQLVSVLRITNSFTLATNLPGVTNVNNQFFSRDTITYFTNHSFIVYPISCLTNTVSLREGVDKITFIRKDFDSLLGRFYSPITNTYHLKAVTNNTVFVQTFRRLVTLPDILFSAADIVTGPEVTPLIIPTVSRETPRWNTNNIGSSGAGPGTVDPGSQFTLNKVGPIFDQPNFFFVTTSTNYPLQLDESTHYLRFIWASFDGTTNAPIVYPVGTSITNLVDQIFLQVTTDTLPDGQVSVPYQATLSATGGQSPYTWTLSPASAGLPAGLALSSDGTISGTPTTDGVYDVVVRAADATGRTTDRAFALTIFP
jgi:hypothetical protein